MKRCYNPNCASDFLFGNDKVTCPFCHQRLVDIGAAHTGQPPILPVDLAEPPMPTGRNNPPFASVRMGRMTCHGRIVEIDRQELFVSKFHKLINSLFRGEPYQLAHQTIEYTIRVENISDAMAEEVTDFCLYGNYLGRLQVGDEVEIRAKNHRNRRVVTSLYNRTTSSRVRPGFQIPAWAVRTGVTTFVMFIGGSVAMLADPANNGIYARSLLAGILLLACLWYVIRRDRPGRRRR